VKPEATGRVSVRAELPFDYVLREADSSAPRELILLLHGYSESGKRIFTKLSSSLPEDVIVLAPNGPFMMAQKTDEGYKTGYSWYFYNFQTDEYVIDMTTALEFLVGGIEKLGYSKLPLRIIGFSQGGYLAPFLGQRLANTKHVISLHSTYLHEELGVRLDFRADNVVGSEDEIIDSENSARSHAEIVKRSKSGAFFRIAGVGHRIDSEVASKVGELVQRE
jgi:predicted esterase